MVGDNDRRAPDSAATTSQVETDSSSAEHNSPALPPTDISDPRNRRNHQRVDVDIRGIVESELGPDASEMLMSNLSIGGCFLRCKTPESPGNLVMVRFTLPGSTDNAAVVKAVGRVAWIRPGQHGGMGIQFIRVDDGDLTELHRYIAGAVDNDAQTSDQDDENRDRRAA